MGGVALRLGGDEALEGGKLEEHYKQK